MMMMKPTTSTTTAAVTATTVTAILRWHVETAWETIRTAGEMCERLEAIGTAMEALAEATAAEMGIDITDVLDPLVAVDAETCLS
jgi:hypothetical protein